MIEVDKLTLGEIKMISGIINCGGQEGYNQKHPYIIGEKYLIRTVTMIYTGRLVDVFKDELTIEDAAWIADTARWHECLKEGSLEEVEPYPDGQVIIGRGAILDVAVWKHDLPRESK